MEKILIVDDMAYMRMLLKKYLISHGYTDSDIQEAKDGLEALKLSHTFKPDIVLLDLMLPKISGLNLIHLLLNLSKNIKILVISVINDLDVYSKAIDAGAVDWLKKPVQEDEFIRKLNEIKNKKIKNENYTLAKEPASDPSDKISIKLDMNKSLQILNLYGKFNDKDLEDVIETIKGLLPYKYTHIILNLNGVTEITGDINKFQEIKNLNLKFVLLKNDTLQQLLSKIGFERSIYKTELQAINSFQRS